MNYIYSMTTLEALIELELMALATISQLKATVYKTWQPLAEKWQHLASDTCTEHDSQFVLDLPSLPEKVQPDLESVEVVLDNGMTIFDLGYCECMTNAEFVDLVASHVKPDQQFNLLPYGFDSPITLSEDNLYLMFWFEKYITDDYTIVFDDCQPIRDGSNGYQVAQQIVLVFYVWLQSVFVSCLDFLDRLIQIVHNVRFVLVYRVTNDDSFVFIDIGETA